MGNEFTAFVQTLATLGPESPMPDGEIFRSFMKKFRRVLRWEMRRKGLWTQPPAYLCVPGAQSYQASGGDPFREVIHECFLYIFKDRLRAVVAQLRRKKNVEGFLARNVRNFLHERQRHCDPFGYRVYQRVAYGVETAAQQGLVRLSHPKIGSSTGVIFGESSKDPRAEPLPPGFVSTVRSFNDDLMPDLVALRGQPGFEHVAEVLCRRLPELGQLLPEVRFGDILSPLRTDARARWGARIELDSSIPTEPPPTANEGEDSEWVPAALLRQLQPGPTFAARLHFHELTRCVRTAIGHAEIPDKIRGYLERLWEGLALYAADPDADGDEPTARDLGRRLGIPRGRVPELLGNLGRFVKSCTEPKGP